MSPEKLLAGKTAVVDGSEGSPARIAALIHDGARGVIASLKLRDATLSDEQANDMAVVLLQNMKTLKSLDVERNAGAIAELRAMTALYLKSKLEK